MTTAQRQKNAALDLVKIVCRALDDKKAENLQVLDVSAHSSITDYLVLATGTSEPHLRALRVELEKVIDAAQIKLVGVDSNQGSGWLVVDAFDVMVHLFTPQMRTHYGLEVLWKDAVDVSVPRLLAVPKPVKPARAPRRATAPSAPKKAKAGKTAKADVKAKPRRATSKATGVKKK